MFEELEPLLRAFWYIALASTSVFVIQTILTFMGSNSMEGVEADFDGNLDSDSAPFQMFSFRNLINFMLGFGWTGVAFYSLISNKILLIILACAVGVAFILMFFFLIKQILKLTEDNTFNIEKLIGKIGTVYLNIPPEKTGVGKVQVSLNGSVHELLAFTEASQMIKTNEAVKIVAVQDEILIVEKI